MNPAFPSMNFSVRDDQAFMMPNTAPILFKPKEPTSENAPRRTSDPSVYHPLKSTLMCQWLTPLDSHPFRDRVVCYAAAPMTRLPVDSAQEALTAVVAAGHMHRGSLKPEHRELGRLHIHNSIGDGAGVKSLEATLNHLWKEVDLRMKWQFATGGSLSSHWVMGLAKEVRKGLCEQLDVEPTPELNEFVRRLVFTLMPDNLVHWAVQGVLPKTREGDYSLLRMPDAGSYWIVNHEADLGHRWLEMSAKGPNGDDRDELGLGGFGRVRWAKSCATGDMYALKKNRKDLLVRMAKESPDSLDTIKRKVSEVVQGMLKKELEIVELLPPRSQFGMGFRLDPFVRPHGGCVVWPPKEASGNGAITSGKATAGSGTGAPNVLVEATTLPKSYLVMDLVKGLDGIDWANKVQQDIEDSWHGDERLECDYIATQSEGYERYTMDRLRWMARSLLLLHRHGVAHRDFKPENLVFPADGQWPRGFCHLLDFSSLTKDVSDAAAGTAGYAPPESVLSPVPDYHREFEGVSFDEYHGFAHDVWSFGITAAMMLASAQGRIDDVITPNGPWNIETIKQGAMKFIFDGHPPLPDSVYALIAQCLAFRPKERITMEGIWSSPVMRQAVAGLDLEPAFNYA